MTRTGLQGFLYYIAPDFEGVTLQWFLQILLDAMSQLFFSLVVSMGIKITYGSYVKKDVNLGKAGTFVGARFFITAIFATLTSCISILESIAANCVEIFHTDRKKTVLVLSVIYLAASAVIALGYGVFYFELPLPNGSVGQLLDRMDYISNSVMMFVLFLQSTGILS